MSLGERKRNLQVWIRVGLLVMVGCSGCGGRSRQEILNDLREAMQRRVESDQVLEHQVRVAREVVESGALEGMQKHELLEKIGPGRRCGFVEMCAQRGFSPEDWVYDIGRAPENPGLPAGPMILVGFDSAGRVLRTFWIARGAPRPAR